MFKGKYVIHDDMHRIKLQEDTQDKDSTYYINFDPVESVMNGAKEGDEVEFIQWCGIEVVKILEKVTA